MRQGFNTYNNTLDGTSSVQEYTRKLKKIIITKLFCMVLKKIRPL